VLGIELLSAIAACSDVHAPLQARGGAKCTGRLNDSAPCAAMLPTNACGHEPGERSGPCGHLWSTSAYGNRESSCGFSYWVGTYASYCTTFDQSSSGV
jgi:hypothetical protein